MRSHYGAVGPMRPFTAAILVAAMVIISLTGCSSSPEESAAFCDRLSSATGQNGAENLFGEFDPARLTETTRELTELETLAPESIAQTMSTLVELFTEIEATDSNDLPALLIDNEREMRLHSSALTDYALDECGLFLQRAQPPTPTPAPLLGSE